MFLLSVTDTAGKRVQINGDNIAYFTPDSAGKGSVIAFAVAGAEGLVTMRVADTTDALSTLIQAKLRK
jgi:hypothetical protein